MTNAHMIEVNDYKTAGKLLQPIPGQWFRHYCFHICHALIQRPENDHSSMWREAAGETAKPTIESEEQTIRLGRGEQNLLVRSPA